jgi:enoyl-CoA hydratase
MTAYTEVLFEEIRGKGGDLGVITLNRPQVLNSLNQSMAIAIHQQLQEWEYAQHIKAVVIRAAEGRAFCAGGDLRLAYERIKENNPAKIDFFRDEYQLNRKIYHYPKPYIAFLDGITMGGGVGLSIHGSHRIATDRLTFAMPETGIGFFPDVGGTYFLPRLKGYMGYYLGLTGARINSDDCVYLGIANLKVAQDALPTLLTVLAENEFEENARLAVTKLIEPFHLVTSSSLLMEQQAIDGCFEASTVETITEALQHSDHSICKEASKSIQKKSPTSLKVSLKALQLGKHLNFDECMDLEYRLVTRFLQEHDFAEGIRAVIIDKDQQPHWQPNTLEAVKNQEVEKYFSAVHEDSFSSPKY